MHGIIKLLDPPFEKSDLNPGYIKSYLPGVRENGGQYTHSAIWAVIAFALSGRNDKAMELYKIINPINHSKTTEEALVYKVEPYAIAADIYGKGNLLGRGGWTWYTGSSSWFYKAGIEYLLGLKIEKGYLTLAPHIPNTWNEYTIRLEYKTSIYNIKVCRGEHCSSADPNAQTSSALQRTTSKNKKNHSKRHNHTRKQNKTNRQQQTKRNRN